MGRNPAPPARSAIAVRAVLAATLLVLAVAVAPVAAKEGMTATLDAPIPMGEPGGTVLAVGVRVEILSETGYSPVFGSPIFLELTGRTGEKVREYLTETRDEPGHYLGRIAVPAGGARGVAVGMGGSSDIFAILGADPLAFGRISPKTAQLAPPKVVMTPFPRVSTAPLAAPAGAAGQDPAATPAPAAPASPAWPLVAGLAALVLAAVVGGILLARAGRGARGPRADAAGRGAGR